MTLNIVKTNKYLIAYSCKIVDDVVIEDTKYIFGSC